VRRDQALEVVVGQALVDAVIERCGRGIKISPDQCTPRGMSGRSQRPRHSGSSW